MIKPHYEVVCAVIIKDDLIFCCKRNGKGACAYKWEFPGGKIEPGETKEEANENVETELIALFEKVTNEEDLDQTISSLVALWQIAKQDTYNEYTDYAPYIGWYLAIAYLEDYEKDRAVDILEEMELMYPEGTVIGDMVKELIKELQ